SHLNQIHVPLPLPRLPSKDFFGYEELERQLKEVFKERSNILHQLLKTSKELQGIKVNLQALRNDEASTKSDVQKLLELGQNQREMKSLQEALQKQLNEAAEKAEKQQATINFLKTEMERKSRIIRDLQNENKSLKNKLLSGNKLCGIHAEEVRKIPSVLNLMDPKEVCIKVFCAGSLPLGIILANLQLLSTFPLEQTEMLQEHPFFVLVLSVGLCQPEKHRVFPGFSQCCAHRAQGLCELRILSVIISKILWVQLPPRELLQTHTQTHRFLVCAFSCASWKVLITACI
uniref:Leucine zipper protein 2 n=1 Tax=Cyanoderma ruficeps TaxID=181631 RepID=A0A8C3R4Y8_9PASS